jgi:AraC-like DNA-binding protein
MDNHYSKWSHERLKRIGVINRFIDGSISRAQAATLAGISERQVTRIAKEVTGLGAGAYLHKNNGNSNAATIDAEMKETILDIYSRPEYKSVNFLHFHDSLFERHGISIAYASLVSILKNAGNESPKKKKPAKPHRRRKRKEREGELLQIDASPFDWFRTGEMQALHGAIDDATGIPVGLYMCRNECRLGYLEVMRQCELDHGSPLSLYSDNHTIFRSPKTGKLTIEDILRGGKVPLTQFGRAMDELGINIIYARSAPAKGRVERMWETLQSRLPVEFALDGITSIEAANEYLHDKIIPYYKQRWSVEAEGGSIYVPLRENVDIDTILCVKEIRRTDNAGAFSIKGKAFQVIDDGFPLIPKGQTIEVLIGLRIGIKVRYKDHIFDTVRYIKPEKKIKPKEPPRRKLDAVRPHLVHGSADWKQIWHAEDYGLSLQFLYDLFLSDADVFKHKNLAGKEG